MLLELFLANPSRVLSKQQIQDKLYGWGEEIESNALEVYVHHLRRKITPRSCAPCAAWATRSARRTRRQPEP